MRDFVCIFRGADVEKAPRFVGDDAHIVPQKGRRAIVGEAFRLPRDGKPVPYIHLTEILSDASFPNQGKPKSALGK